VRGSGARRALALLLALAAAAACAAPRPAERLVTGIEPADCRMPEPAVASLYKGAGVGVEECPAPAGYRLFLVSSDARSWLDLGRDGSIWTTEEPVAYGDAPGLFPNVAGSTVAWRLGPGGAPRALIFRVLARDPAQPEGTRGEATLMRRIVIGLGDDRPCLIGVAASEEDARALADRRASCKPLVRRG